MIWQMQKSMLRQTLHMRVANDTHKIQVSDWAKWRYIVLLNLLSRGVAASEDISWLIFLCYILFLLRFYLEKY